MQRGQKRGRMVSPRGSYTVGGGEATACPGLTEKENSVSKQHIPPKKKEVGPILGLRCISVCDSSRTTALHISLSPLLHIAYPLSAI